MNRLDSLFQKLQGKKQKAFVAFITAGDPSLQKTVELALAIEKAGADIVELGVPFSDPLADGVVNQLAAQRALNSGTTLRGILDVVCEIRKKSQIPIVFFTYYNPIFHFGLKKFLVEAEKTGADGALILDLPPEEAEREWPKNSPLKRISLIAPTTPRKRVEEIVKTSGGFIYYVSRTGVTGMQSKVASELAQHIKMIRLCSPMPICVGFGISNPEQAKAVSQIADGVVVGSAIVDQIAKHGSEENLPERIFQFVQPMTQATKS